MTHHLPCKPSHFFVCFISRHVVGLTLLSRYTRNGELLGDGFVSVYESNLVPVVGFHSNGESVRVNFGLTTFAYEVRMTSAGIQIFRRFCREPQTLSCAEGLSQVVCVPPAHDRVAGPLLFRWDISGTYIAQID